MLGSVNTTSMDTGVDEEVVKGFFTTMVEPKRDLAHHVWAVAIHRPNEEMQIAEKGKPEKLNWELVGLDAASGNALARAKQTWNQKKMNKENGRVSRMSR